VKRGESLIKALKREVRGRNGNVNAQVNTEFPALSVAHKRGSEQLFVLEASELPSTIKDLAEMLEHRAIELASDHAEVLAILPKSMYQPPAKGESGVQC